MGLVEYQIRMEAYQLQQAQRQEELALQAWFNQSVQATTGGKHPKPKFKRFNDFFDKPYLVDQIRGQFEPDYQPTSKRSRQETASEIMFKRMQEFQKMKKGGN